MVLEALRILYVDFPMSRLKSDFPIGTRNGPDALSFGPILEAAAQQVIGDPVCVLFVMMHLVIVFAPPPAPGITMLRISFDVSIMYICLEI